MSYNPRFGKVKAAALIALLSTAPLYVAAEEQRLSVNEARVYALQLLEAGQPKAARAIALGLLRKDSRDYYSLMVLADAERALGRPTAAKFAARRAFHSTEDEKERFGAAFLMSKILKSEGKFSRAQIWLRRAGGATDEGYLDTAARREYARIKAANPWSVSFDFTLSPSSNVNGGPNDNTYTIGDLVFVDEAAVPLSGFEIGAQLDIERRFQLASGKELSFGLAHDERRYVLSDAAKAAVPTAHGSDYAFTNSEFKLALNLAGKTEGARRQISLAAGRNWSGGDPLANVMRLRFSQTRSGEAFARFGYGLGYDKIDRLDTESRSTDGYSANVWGLKALTNGDYLRLGFALSKTDSASSDMAHGAMNFSMAYIPSKPILGARANFSGLLQLREYDRLRYGTSKRRDEKLSLAANFVFTEIDYMGFSPSVTLRATRNISNKSFFDNQEFGISFGIKSTF